MRVSGQHEVVSVGDPPGWDIGMKTYPEMPPSFGMDGVELRSPTAFLRLSPSGVSSRSGWGDGRGGSVGPAPDVALQCGPRVRQARVVCLRRAGRN